MLDRRRTEGTFHPNPSAIRENLMTCPKLCAYERAPRRSKRGTALFAVVPIAILVMALMVAFVGTSIETSRSTVSDLTTFKARAAAQNAASMAIADVWSDFEAALGGAAPQLWTLRAHLDSLNLRDQADVATPERTKYRDQMGLTANVHGRPELDGVEIENVDVYRVDAWDSTSIVVEVDAVARRGHDGSTRERKSSIQEVFTIAPPEWDGLDYALLANNINCVLCHTTIDNAERFYNQNALLAGTFDPVKIGSIDSIHFRGDPDSRIAGVALIGGDAILGDGTDVADWSKFNLQTAKVSGDKLIEDAWGNLSFEDLRLFDPAKPKDYTSMYLDFFSVASQTDLTLPDAFPSPFPDNGGIDIATGTPRPDLAGNRIVDDSEFAATVTGSSGTVSGGNISVIPIGTKITKQRDRQLMRKGVTGETVTGITDGNVYLHGTKANPLVLDGDVAIDGDVIVSGYVVGSGTIRARGNVYIPTDLVYADKNRDTGRHFGVAADGRSNSLAVAAGGNIVVGDFYRPAWGNDSDKAATGEPTGSFNFTMDELAIFNRAEWMKTVPTLPGKAEKVLDRIDVTWKDEKVKEKYKKKVKKYKWVKTGNKIKVTKYKWIWVSNGKKGEYEKKTKKKVEDGFYWKDEKKKIEDGYKWVDKTRWVKTGKKIKVETPKYKWVRPQLTNPYYEPYHTPRYYSFAEGTKVPIFNKKGHFDPATNHWKSEERPEEWDSSKLTYADVDNSSDPLLYNADGSPKAVVSTIAPTDGWIDPKLMQQTIHEAQRDRPSGSRTTEIDATLYSANSILGTIPSTKSPHTDGRLLVNGGIVAADVGILAPEGTQVNYDGRGARSLSITSDSGLVINRRLSAPMISH